MTNLQKACLAFVILLGLGFMLEKLWILLLLYNGKRVELKEENKNIVLLEMGVVSFAVFLSFVSLGLVFGGESKK